MAKSVHRSVQEMVQIRLDDEDQFVAKDRNDRDFLVKYGTTTDGVWVHLVGAAIKEDGNLGLINRNNRMKIVDLPNVYDDKGLSEEFRKHWRGLADG